MNIEIDVLNKIAKLRYPVFAVCGNSDYVIVFNFDEEWNEYNTKTARFKYGGSYTDVVFTGNECPMPVMQDVYNVEIGVFAGDLHTTTSAYLPMKKSILCGSGVPVDPTPSVYNQIIQMLDNINAGMKQYKLTYSNGSIMHDDEALNYVQLKEKLLDPECFVFLIAFQAWHIPCFIQENGQEAIAFSSAFVISDGAYIERIIINEADEIKVDNKALMDQDYLLESFDDYEEGVETYPTSTAVKEYVDSHGGGADWNENDSSSPAYIKNRICWTDDVVTVQKEVSAELFWSDQARNNDGSLIYLYTSASGFGFEDGEVPFTNCSEIIVDGFVLTKNTVPFTDLGTCGYRASNDSENSLYGYAIAFREYDEGFPMVYMSPALADAAEKTRWSTSEFIFKWNEVSEPEVHKIDEKYLPDSYTVKLDLDSATDYYVEAVYPDTEMDKIVSAYEKGNLSISADLISGIIDEYLTPNVILGSDRLLIRASSSDFADEKAQFDESGGCVFDDDGNRHNISDFSYNLGFSGFVVTLSDETDAFTAGNSYQFYFGLGTITRTVPVAETQAFSRLWDGRTWIGGTFYDGYGWSYDYSIIPASFLEGDD